MNPIQFVSPIRLLVSAAYWLLRQFDSDKKLMHRFIKVCKAHGIESTQIYRIFPFNGLLATDFSNLTSTSKKITPKLIEEFCNLFDADRDWLETGYGDCQNKSYTYKYISEIKKVQSEMKELFSVKSIVKLILLAPDNIELCRFETYSPSTPVVIAYCTHHEIDNISLTIYRHTETLYWNYQKTRLHLRAIIDIAVNNGFIVTGSYASDSAIKKLSEGKICFAEALSKRRAIWDPIRELSENSNDSERKLLDEYYQSGTLP